MTEGSKDAYTDETEERTVRSWQTLVDLKREIQTGAVYNFWILGDKERVSLLETKLLSALKASHIEELSVGPTDNPHSLLIRESVRLIGLPENRVIVILKGFERRMRGLTGYDLIREGHDWDQDILEQNDPNFTPLRDEFFSSGKQLICLSVVERETCDREVYDKALRCASGSMRKSGIFRFP